MSLLLQGLPRQRLRRLLPDLTAVERAYIADELGGSKATLWAHFPSKRDLFTAVVEDQVSQFALAIDDVLTGRTFSNAALLTEETDIAVTGSKTHEESPA